MNMKIRYTITKKHAKQSTVYSTLVFDREFFEERQEEHRVAEMDLISVLESAKRNNAPRATGPTLEEEAERDSLSSGAAGKGFFSDDIGNFADDELSKLMSSLTKQFEAFDDDEGTLDFMGDIGCMATAADESFCQNFDLDKENVAAVVSDRRTIRRAQQSRRGSGQVSTSTPLIDFTNLAKIKSVDRTPPSCSLHKSISTVLKENVNRGVNRGVNRAGNESSIVDEFWSTEMEKKISAVARRKLLTEIENPAAAQTKPFKAAVEDMNVSQKCSRGGPGGNSRKLGTRNTSRNRLPDLNLDAQPKFSELDQKVLAEEEVPPCTRRASRARSGKAILARRPQADAEKRVRPYTRARARVCSGGSESDGRPTSNSPNPLPDMELSPAQSDALMEVPELWRKVERSRTLVQGPQSAPVDFPIPQSNLQVHQSPWPSPTPPSDTIGAAISSSRVEGDGDDGEMPDVNEADRRKSSGSSLGDQIEPKGLPHGEGESVGADSVTNQNGAEFLSNEFHNAGNSVPSPPSSDAQRKTRLHTEASIESKDKGNQRKRVVKRKAGNQTRSYNSEGCRRSLRNRVKPLEWWRGEKLLYAIHDSLMTIVGIARP
ncbi:unnamed protein product [Calypogeia fissa]